MKLRYAMLLLPVLLGSPVHAAGINLAWNDCGTSGLPLATFACNTNVGFRSLHTSFISPVPMTQLVGMEVVIDVAYNQASVPNWWLMQSTGGCRFGALTSNTNFTAGPFSCADPWQPNSVGGTVIQPGLPTPNRARIRAVAAVPSVTPMTVDDVTEYYAIEIRISNAKTVGAGACSGCEVAACLVLNNIKLSQPAGVGDYLINQPIDTPVVGWQCPALYGAPEPACFMCPVPTKNRTWGSVKGLYR
jgi:hypothetical protein